MVSRRRRRAFRKDGGRAPGPSPEGLVVLSQPDSAEAEAFRTLRTSLLYAVVDDPPRVVVLTSPGPGEGKSTACANLGVALAQAGKRTLIADCDFRSPAQHEVFGLRNFRGIVNLLAGEIELREVWQDTYVPGLAVATVGPLPPKPAELLASRRFAEFVQRARGEFEYVLVDAPPTQPVSDPMVLAAQSDGVLLVLDAQRTRKGAVRRSIRDMEAVDARMLGTVMNRMPTTKVGYYGGYAYDRGRD